MSARLRTALLVNLAMVVEQANEQVLPAVYLFVGRSLNATPVQLGTLTLCRAMVQTLASPLSGILGDRYNRVLVLSSGAFIWGIMTSAMALTVTLHQAMAFAGFNGLGLALLVPCCQSLIADLYPAEQRGRAFGTLQLTASLGGMLGGVFATNMGGAKPLGMDGWRAAFHCIAALSLLVGALALFFASDPRRLRRYSLLPATDVNTLLAAGPRPQSPLLHQHTATAAGGSEVVMNGQSYSMQGVDDAQCGKPDSGSTERSVWFDGGQQDGSGSALMFRPYHVTMSGKAGEQLLLPHHSQDHSQLADQHEHKAASALQDHHSLDHTHQNSSSTATEVNSGTARPRAARQLSPARGLPLTSAARVSWLDSTGAGPALKSADEDAVMDVRGRTKGRKRGVVADICWMLQIKTFQAIVLQGIVGCFPWQAMVFFTLWLQLTGFSDTTASLLVATFGAGVAGGALLGGAVGDRMAKRLPNNGRILTAQVSVFCGIPLTWILIKGLPGSVFGATPVAYAFVMFTMGLTCTWAGAGCNSPIFAEIVPDELRSTIYAFDRSFENSIAACAAPVVGLLAERVFGFTGVLNDDALKDHELRRHNASALGSSLLACMALPWSLCLVFYTALHFFYPQDKAMARTWSGGSGSTAIPYH